MGKDTGSILSGTTKYLIRARFETNGMCEKSDVVGALFGQTDGDVSAIGVKLRAS